MKILPIILILLILGLTYVATWKILRKQSTLRFFRSRTYGWFHFVFPAVLIIAFLSLRWRLQETLDFRYMSVAFYFLTVFLSHLFIQWMTISFFLVFALFRLLIRTINGRYISRGYFLWPLRAMVVLSSLAFGYGMLFGKTNLQVKEVTITSKRIPEDFDGFRIVQFSDLHAGSFMGKSNYFEKIVKLTNSLNPDVILFTGDFVNELSEEAILPSSVFKKFKSNYGNYAVLGNHDFADYFDWADISEKEEDRKNIVRLIRESGFTLLRDSCVYVHLGDDSIAIAGVDNWGLPPFHPYGNLEKAVNGIPSSVFTVLLSHDPTHWDAEILPKSKVDLTVSGHTHGAQFSLRPIGIDWSPVTLRYKQWGGLYSYGNRYLHISTGVGFIGMAARVGMPPELVLIVLKSE